MLALLYDVHGNLPALEAVLEDVAAQGADTFVLGGDYALFGAWPLETVQRLRDLDAAWIRGNGERWVGDPQAEDLPEVMRGAALACREALGEATSQELAALAFDHVHGNARFVHASPVSDMRSFLPEPGDDDAELLAGVSQSHLVFGHTHLPFRREASGIDLLNPGSVGMPFDGDPRASWALVHDDGSPEHRRVAYDHAASATAVRERFDGEWTEVVARRIETASFESASV